jgi:hypothetical protein
MFSQMPERTNSPSDSGRVGAVIVGGLLLIVLAVAILSSFIAKRQLDDAARAQVAITSAQERLDDLLRTQLDEEAQLREALAAQQRTSDPYASMDDPFVPLLQALAGDLRDVGVPNGRGLTENLAATHRLWVADVAYPLRLGASPQRAAGLEAQGKILVDRFETEVLNLRTTLQARMSDVQHQLGLQINETVGYSAGFIVLFAFAAVVLSVRSSMTRARLEREHSIVETFEDALRVGWEPLPATAVGSRYLSATVEAQVGGDLIDMWRLDERRGVVLIADVSGKGIEAAVNTAFVKYSIRTLASELEDPGLILSRFNDLFIQTIANPSLFVEVFLGIFDTHTGRLLFASGGHGCAFLRRGEQVEILPTTGPIVGVDADATFEVRDVDLSDDDVLLLTTDGFTEARNQDGELLGEEGAVALVESGPAAPQPLCDHLVDSVTARSGGRITDDLALLAIAPIPAQASLRLG